MKAKVLVNNISEHDRALIDEAYKATYACEIDEYLAESEETRQILHRRAVFLHHREEAWAGML